MKTRTPSLVHAKRAAAVRLSTSPVFRHRTANMGPATLLRALPSPRVVVSTGEFRATLAAIALLSATKVAVFNAVIAHPLSFRSVSKLCSASLNFFANLSIVTSAVTICKVLMSTTHAIQVASTTPASFFQKKKYSDTRWVQGRVVQSQKNSWNMDVPPDDTTLKLG